MFDRINACRHLRTIASCCHVALRLSLRLYPCMVSPPSGRACSRDACDAHLGRKSVHRRPPIRAQETCILGSGKDRRPFKPPPPSRAARTPERPTENHSLPGSAHSLVSDWRRTSSLLSRKTEVAASCYDAVHRYGILVSQCLSGVKFTHCLFRFF